jgi:hypothetical protein
MFTVSKDTTSSSVPQSFAKGAMIRGSLIKQLGQNSFAGTLHELRINLPSRIPHILLTRGCKMQVHTAFPVSRADYARRGWLSPICRYRLHNRKRLAILRAYGI